MRALPDGGAVRRQDPLRKVDRGCSPGSRVQRGKQGAAKGAGRRKSESRVLNPESGLVTQSP